MKQFTVALISLGLIFSTSLAFAKDHDHGHHKYDRHGDHHKAYSTKKKKHARHHRQVHKSTQRKIHRSSVRHRRSNSHQRYSDNHHVRHHAHRSEKRRHRNHRDKAGYLLGGMFLGAVINELATQNNKVVKETVYVDSDVGYKVQEYSYLRDSYGHCYSVEYRDQGRVLREVPSVFCE